MPRPYTLGVIGVGNMGASLVRGIVRAGAVPAEKIIVSDPAPGKCEELARELGVRVAPDNVSLARDSDFVVLVLKPWMIGPVVREIEPALTEEQGLVSMATGISLHYISQALTKVKPCLIRVMPNTPAAFGVGALALAAPEADPEKVAVIREVLSAVGRVISVEEPLLDAVTGLSGSGPAFVFVMIEALADGAVAAGLPRAIALELAAQTVLGAATMVLHSGQHPGQLKDMVTTPAGTTIAGLEVLESAGFRGALLRAVRAAAQRAAELSKGK